MKASRRLSFPTGLTGFLNENEIIYNICNMYIEIFTCLENVALYTVNIGSLGTFPGGDYDRQLTNMRSVWKSMKLRNRYA